MGSFWSTFATRAQSLGSHWTSYTVLGSFFLYALGYLTLRFHLTVLGVGTDLSVIDERYLFTGTRFLIYLVSSVPSLLLLLLLLGLLLVVPIYLPYRLLPASMRKKVGGVFYRQWQHILSWWSVSNRLALLGIIFALLMIQLVMRQCFLLNNLLLAEDLPVDPAWLRYLLIAQTDGPMALYFSGLLAGILVSGSIFYQLISKPDQTTGAGTCKSLLGFLLCVQLLLLPVNYGILVLDKSMPQVAGLDALGVLAPNEQAWLIWEGNEGKTFLLRKQQGTVYKRSLITLPKSDVQRLEIFRYDHIFKFLFSKATTKPTQGNRIKEQL